MTTSAGNASSLDREKVLVLVKEQLAEILETTPDDIAEDVPFTDLGADSLALIELVEDLEGLQSVRDAVDYVVVKLQVA